MFTNNKANAELRQITARPRIKNEYLKCSPGTRGDTALITGNVNAYPSTMVAFPGHTKFKLTSLAMRIMFKNKIQSLRWVLEKKIDNGIIHAWLIKHIQWEVTPCQSNEEKSKCRKYILYVFYRPWIFIQFNSTLVIFCLFFRWIISKHCSSAICMSVLYSFFSSLYSSSFFYYLR